MTENFNILVNKLNSFKFKYYGYQVIKGLLLTLFTALVLFMLFSILEYSIYLPSNIRKLLFFGYLIFTGLLFIQFVGIPLLKLTRVLKPIDITQTSKIIQTHFSEIKDKLLNIIELAYLNENKYSSEINEASINQKINEIKWYNFNDAVQFKNLKYVFISLLISILSVFGISIYNKNILKESSQRIIHYNTQFVQPAPFTFELLNTDLNVKKGDSYLISAQCKGEEIPQIVYVNIEGNNYLMRNVKAGLFEFEINSVINPFQFYFTDLEFHSKSYFLTMLPKPGITNFTVKTTPPSYTILSAETVQIIGDIQVPHGTNVSWEFAGIDIDSLFIVVNDSNYISADNNNDLFVAEKTFYQSGSYNVFVKNSSTEYELALSYSIDVTPDLYPEIQVTQLSDSTKLTRFFFRGVIGDDYGFSNLAFHFNINNTDSAIYIPFVRNLNDQDFYFSFDFANLELNSGIISYYFTVSDNDIINGFKTTSSDNYIFTIPNKNEILASEKEQFDKLQNMLNKSSEMANEIKKDLDNLRLKNMDTNISDWEKSQMVNEIVSKQNQLEKMYDQIKQNNEQLNNYLNSFNQQNQEIVEKQKQIEELMEEVFTDELQKLMEEFQKLTENFDSKRLNELSEQMDMSFDDLQKQLDRNLEMLKKMKMEEKIQQAIDDVNRIANEEQKLAEEVSENKNYEEVKTEVEDHQSELKEIEENLKELMKSNEELEEQMLFDDFDEDFEEIDKSINDSKEELDKNNRKKSGSSIKQTSEKLQNMAFSMQQMLNSNTMQQNMENIENLKQILSNLMFLSFEQENVLVGLSSINSADPQLNTLNKIQKSIVDQSKVIKDSLYALALRTPHITSMVNNELLVMEKNLMNSKEQMEEALFPNARVSQQFVVTAANNLALMLNEALEQLEDQMANAMEGDQQCENPGNGKPGMGAMKKAAQNIKQQLEKMIEQMKNGNPQQMSQQLGESLMQHEMMQQMLRDLMNNGSVGSDAKKTLQEIDNMLEQNRKELMNKSINAQTIARQNLITTRLLEAENAEMEREFEEKRESESADDFYSNPVKFFEYKEKDNYTIEYLNKNSHKLNNFYNYKYKQYINSLQK